MEQDEWIYQNGNEKQDLKLEDCVPWKDKTRIASDCSRICLPINMQYLYEDNVNRPKCQNGSDHICMMKLFMNDDDKRFYFRRQSIQIAQPYHKAGQFLL